MTLLWDNMEEVLMGVVPHLGRTIDLLITSGVLGQEQVRFFNFLFIVWT